MIYVLGGPLWCPHKGLGQSRDGDQVFGGRCAQEVEEIELGHNLGT